MGKRKTHEEFVAEVAKVNPNIEIIGQYTKSTNRIACKCNIDGFEWNPEAAALVRKKSNGCPVCAWKKLVPGYNDIPTLAPWMIPYFQGGIEEAKQYTRTSTKKIIPICPECGRIKPQPTSVVSIYVNHSVGCICSDGISYPNKFSYALLNQLNVQNWIPEYYPEWAKPYRFDNYFEYKGKKYILEMDGGLGHGKKCWDHSKDTVGLIKDEKKDSLAFEHDIQVLRIDATYSNLNYIKNSILNNNIFVGLFKDSINNIDWDDCNIYAQKSNVKKVCDYWENEGYTVPKLAEMFHVSTQTIRNYLKNGHEIGFCDYSRLRGSSYNLQPMLCNNKYAFFSKNALIRHSNNLFNIKLTDIKLDKYFKQEITFDGLVIEKVSKDFFKTYQKDHPELSFH